MCAHSLSHSKRSLDLLTSKHICLSLPSDFQVLKRTQRVFVCCVFMCVLVTLGSSQGNLQYQGWKELHTLKSPPNPIIFVCLLLGHLQNYFQLWFNIHLNFISENQLSFFNACCPLLLNPTVIWKPSPDHILFHL